MNRRTFLKRGLAGAAVLALGAGGLAVLPTKHLATPKRALAALSPRGFQVLVAFARRVVPERADPVDVVHGIDDGLRLFPREVRADVDKLLGLFENALPGLLLDGRMLPFTRLSPASQDAVMRHWRDSRIELRRAGYESLRRLCLAAAYKDEALWAAVGYAAPPVGTFEPIAYDDSKAGAT
jgi:hypothetical protein